MNNLRMAFRNSLLRAFSGSGSTPSLDRLRTSLTTGRSGQVAVIMIVIIAIGLVLFAASINLTIMSQSKTLTMKAASASSSTMASMLASYGERYYIETLGGQIEKCHKTTGFGFLVAIIMIVIAIVFYQPELIGLTAGAMTAQIAAAAAVSAVMEVASVMIAATVDPGIADMWNKMQNANLSQTGQFLEKGIQTALQNSVTDQVKLPDLYDLDQDGLFGYPAGTDSKVPGNVAPLDTISRFSLYNTKRFLDLKPTDTTAVEAFLNALHELAVLPGDDNWALWDPVFYPNTPPDPSSPAPPACSLNSTGHPCCVGMADPAHFPAECDICCQYDQTQSAPAYCYAPCSANNPCTPENPAGVTQIGDAISCGSRSPFRTLGNLYPAMYDPTYEDSRNAFMSFREQLGRDDEHHLYHVGSNNPNWHGDPINGPQSLNDGQPADQGFFLKDVVGYYTYPGLTTPDQWMSVNPPPSPKFYPFLYKMKDWGPELKNLDYNNYQGHWCDPRSGKNPVDLSPEIGQLSLSSPNLLTYSGGWCVDKENKRADGSSIGASDQPILADNVPGLPNSLFVPQNKCGFNSKPDPVSDINQYIRGWKRGADRYCSASAPYDVDCAKHVKIGANQDNLACDDTRANGTDPTLWPDDVMDQIIYGAPVLFATEATLYKNMISGVGKVVLTKTLDEWYPTVADWIEPPCPDPANCPGSYTKQARPGALWIWRAELGFYNDKIQKWLKPAAGQEYSGQNCAGPDSVWCIPPDLGGANQCPGVSAAEAATFDANGNGTRGDLYDVIQCLKWNTEDTRTYLDGSTARGNAEKFQKCADVLNAPLATCVANAHDACTNLPRSLVAIPAFVEPGAGDQALYTACLTSPTIDQCALNCPHPPLPAGSPPDTLPAFNQPSVDVDRFIGPSGDLFQFCQANPTGTQSGVCNTTYVPSGQLQCDINFNECMCSWAGSCLGFGACQTYCNTYVVSDPLNTCKVYFNAVADASISPEIGGSCADQTFKDAVQTSANEAKVQVEKFKHRITFLDGRYQEAMSLSNAASLGMDATNPTDGILTTGIQKITEFIDGGTDFTKNSEDSPSERFIKARTKMASADSGDLPSFALYVWQDADPIRANPAGHPRWSDDTGKGGGEGYWHAVKVEANIPRRCSGDCLALDWPTVVSHESSHMGLFSSWHKVCYKLENLVGMTKTRVIRYDQDKDLRGLIFPSGQRIWESKLSHPQETSAPDPTGLRVTCADLIDPDLVGWLADTDDPRSKLGAAFMFNQIPQTQFEEELIDPNDPNSGYTARAKYAQCWVRVHQALLAHGIQSESCAEYYFANNPETENGITQTGFRVKFVPCIGW